MGSTKIKILAIVIVAVFAASIATPIAIGQNESQAVDGTFDGSSEKKAIQSYLDSLKGTYDPDTVIVYTGETVTQKPYEFSGSDSETVTIKYTKQSVDNFDDKAMSNLSSQSTKVYPGALLVADNDLAGGNPNSLSFNDRGDVVLSCTLANSGGTVTVNPQQYGDVRSGIESMVDKWADNGGALSANITTESVNDSSSKQSSISLGIDLDILDGIGINTDSDKDTSKTSVVIKYTQVFYTVSAAIPANSADYFGPNTTASQVKSKITSAEPAVYVSSVTYGRMVVAQYTTTSTIDNFKAAVDLTISGNSGSLTSEQKEAMDNSSFQACVVGGDGTTTKLASIDDVNNIINSTPNVGDVRGAAMLTANTVFVDSSKNAYSYQSTEYLEKSVFKTTKIDVSLNQDGWYDLHVKVYANVYESINSDGTYKNLENNKCVIDSGRVNLNVDKLWEITAKHTGDIKLSLEVYSASDFFSNQTLSPTPTSLIEIHTGGDLWGGKDAEVKVDGVVYYHCGDY